MWANIRHISKRETTGLIITFYMFTTYTGVKLVIVKLIIINIYNI